MRSGIYLESDGNIVTGCANADDVATDGISVIVGRASRAADNIEGVLWGNT